MQLKLVNLNIWLGGKLFDFALDFLRKEGPDILSLQEVYNALDPKLPQSLRTFEALKKELGYGYGYFSRCFRDSSVGVDRGNAILSRFPITKTDSVYYDRPYGVYSENNIKDFPFFPRTLQHASIKIGNSVVDVFNTQGIWGKGGGDNKRRLKMSDTIIGQIKDKQNVILAGDFNVKEKTKTIEQIEKYLVNVFKDELKTSFNLERKTDPGYATAVVDMVFVGKNIKVISHSCPQVDISDHLPLVCTFEI